MVMLDLAATLVALHAVSTDIQIRGEAPGDHAGLTLLCGDALDVNGDDQGHEMLIGVPGHDAGATGEITDAGAVIWIEDLSAVTGPIVYADPSTFPHAFVSAEAGEAFGSSVAVGDVDGDGRSEVAVGAPEHLWGGATGPPGYGRAVLLTNGADWADWSTDAPSMAALIVEIGQEDGGVGASLGDGVLLVDADGDGLDDLLAVAPDLPVEEVAAGIGRGTGFAVLIPGADVDLAGPPAVMDVRHGQYGMAASGDLDDGSLHLVHAIADLDGDGTPELGAVDLAPAGADPDQASLYLFPSTATNQPGLFETVDAWLRLGPRTSTDALGASVATGDVDGDGATDLILGAPGWGAGGAVLILRGPAEDWPWGEEIDVTEEAVILPADQAGADLGASLLVADLNDDGADDLMVGAPALSAQPGGPEGQVVMVFGGDHLAVDGGTEVATSAALGYRFEGLPDDGMGATLCSPGDLDGDGVLDLAIGAPYATPAAGLDGAGTVWIKLTTDAPDEDGDGVSVLWDCDDGDATTYPADPADPSSTAAPEVCDGVDNDCDGLVPADELDLDGDGWAVCAGDCDDDDPAANLDDADGDGFNTCGVDPADLSADPSLIDCDDSNDAVFPGNPAPDDCSPAGVDDDCDGQMDEDEVDLYYVDSDRDGWGNEAFVEEACFGPGLSDTAGDCDDNDESVHPGAEDPPNDGIDQDCDGSDFIGGQTCRCDVSGPRDRVPAPAPRTPAAIALAAALLAAPRLRTRRRRWSRRPS